MASGVEVRNELVKRAKALGVTATGSNDDLAAAIADAEANQGGSKAPAEDPDAAQAAAGEAGPPPSRHVGPLSSRPSEGLEVPQAPQDTHAAHGDYVNKTGKTRISSTAWWCPRCDNSQLLGEPRCFNCGLARPGDIDPRLTR